MDYLTHYFRKGDPPFRSLSDLSDQAAIAVTRQLQNETGVVYHRFKDPQKYWQARKRTEAWLREEFIIKGGTPRLENPQYMVLGSSFFIQEGYEGNCEEIIVSLEEFDQTEISFTYPDSMVSLMLLEERTTEDYFQPEYHGKVLLTSEILNIAEKFGVPIREWQEDPLRKYDFFIEAQIWSDTVPDKYRK